VASKVRFDKSPNQPAVVVPQARGSYQARDLEETERERGNAEFKAGNFTAATKCYTKCLGMKARNYVAFSNRAMAYLKLKEYARAVVRRKLLDFGLDVPLPV
jgi:tetratricopeptide (TPR) repeat protein